MMEIIIETESHRFEAEIFDTVTGRAILEVLPIQARLNTWGDEIYFPVSVQIRLESTAKAEVNIGELAYWPTMPAFCVFFGPTPASISGKPRAASAVNVFGQLRHKDIPALQSIKDGTMIRVSSKADRVK